MPFLSRLMIRLALIYFLFGIVIGAVLLINKAWPFNSDLWVLLPLHIELMIFGWIVQFTLGVAYWILPRFLGGEMRGSTNRAKLMIILYNAGLWMVAFSQMDVLPPEVSFAGRIVEAVAVLLFVSLHWKRVVTYNR